MKFKTIIFVIIFCLTLTTVMAHPGKTDNSGGHTCKTNCGKWGLDYGEYHFHGTSSITTPTVTTNQTTEPNLKINKNKSESRFFEKVLDNIFEWLRTNILPHILNNTL